MGGHQAPDAGFLHRCLERRQIEFPELALAHVHGCRVKTAGRLAASDEMLCTGHHRGRSVAIAPLESEDGIFAELAHEICILPEGLSHPAPAGVAGDVEIRTECPRNARLAHLRRGFAADGLHHLRIEGRGHSYVRGIDCTAYEQAVAVDGVHANEERNLHPALLRHFLQGDGFRACQHVQERTHEAAAHLVGDVLVAKVLVGRVDVLVRRALSRRDIAGTHVLAHLADLFLKGHLLEYESSTLLGGEGRIHIVLLCASGSEKEHCSYEQ